LRLGGPITLDATSDRSAQQVSPPLHRKDNRSMSIFTDAELHYL